MLKLVISDAIKTNIYPAFWSFFIFLSAFFFPICSSLFFFANCFNFLRTSFIRLSCFSALGNDSNKTMLKHFVLTTLEDKWSHTPTYDIIHLINSLYNYPKSENLHFNIFALVNDVFKKRYHHTMSSAYANTGIAELDKDVGRIVDVFNTLAFLAQVEIRTIPSVENSTTVYTHVS